MISNFSKGPVPHLRILYTFFPGQNWHRTSGASVFDCQSRASAFAFLTATVTFLCTTLRRSRSTGVSTSSSVVRHPFRAIRRLSLYETAIADLPAIPALPFMKSCTPRQEHQCPTRHLSLSKASGHCAISAASFYVTFVQRN